MNVYQHVTVVYYSSDNRPPDAFYVMYINEEKLQKAFDDHDVKMIKCITIELEGLTFKDAKTLFTESDIKNFLDQWSIDY